MEYEWYKEDDDHTAPLYAARTVLPYLLLANLRAANECYRAFTSALTSDNKGLGVQDVSSTGSDLRVFPSLPLLNFLGMLLLAVQRGSPDLYRQLSKQYAAHIAEAGTWAEPLETIAEMYFNIQRPRQSNPLFDIMGSMFGGGGGGFGGGSTSQPPTRKVEAPAPEGLD